MEAASVSFPHLLAGAAPAPPPPPLQGLVTAQLRAQMCSVHEWPSYVLDAAAVGAARLDVS